MTASCRQARRIEIIGLPAELDLLGGKQGCGEANEEQQGKGVVGEGAVQECVHTAIRAR